MQVNLAEIASADVANLLPKAGILYFFFHWHSAEGPQAEDAGLVLFHRGGEQRLRRVAAPAELHSGGRFRGFELTPHLEWTIPKCDSTNYHFPFWDNLDYLVAQAQGFEDGWGPARVHRLLGHPECLQAAGLSKTDALLLQLSSDGPAIVEGMAASPETGMIWGDGGRIYYIISKTDLKEHNFGNAWAVMEDQ
jgi:hypothetical protein